MEVIIILPGCPYSVRLSLPAVCAALWVPTGYWCRLLLATCSCRAVRFCKASVRSLLQFLRRFMAAYTLARALWLEGFNICLKGLLDSAMSRSVFRSPFCPTHAIAPNNVTVTLLGAFRGFS